MFKVDLSAREPGVYHITREVEGERLAETPAGDEESSEEAGQGEEGAGSPVTEEVAFGLVQVDAVLDYQPGRALVTFQARTEATLVCDRTLRRFQQPIEGGYAVLFAEPGRSAPDQSDQHDELRELSPGARHLDLTDAVRDTLLLAVPQRKVAPGAEDEEIDTVFGAPTDEAGEAPVDPRWEKLRQLRTDSDET